MRPLALLALLPLTLAAPAIAQQSDAKTASTVAQTSSSADQTSADHGKSAKPKEKKICHREIVTGSISPHFVCRTQSQIDADKRASDESFDRTTQMARVPGVTR